VSSSVTVQGVRPRSAITLYWLNNHLLWRGANGSGEGLN